MGGGGGPMKNYTACLPRQSLLHEMVAIDRMDWVARLLDSGTGVNTPDCMGDTPLFWATSPEAIDYLVGEGADIEWKNTLSGCSAFFKFAMQGKTKPMKALAVHLRQRGKLEDSVNEKAQYTKRSPLHCAAINGYAGTVRELLAMGAKKDEKDSYGKTALKLAESKNFDEVVALLQ